MARRAPVIGGLAIVAVCLGAAIGSAQSLAAPSSARAELYHQTGFGDGFVGYQLTVASERFDPAPHHLVVTYDGAAIVISDSAGIASQPPNPLDPESQNDPEDACSATDVNSVRCPIDLGSSKLVLTAFDIDTGAGADEVDLRSFPALPGHRPPDSTESRPAAAAPRVRMGQRKDTLLSGPGGQSASDLGRANDVFVGAGGDELVSGSFGDDRLYGRGGSDFLLGGRGDDLVKGGPGRDRLTGDRGDDRLLSRDGTPDAINCGVDNRGHDSVVKDRFDHPFRYRFGRRINCD